MLGNKSQFPLGLTIPFDPRNHLQASTSQPHLSHVVNFKPQSKNNKKTQVSLKGLDVLMAMQRAAAEKSKVKGKNKRKCHVVKNSSRKEEEDEDYSNVRALMVKKEWSVRLDEFEKCLQELSKAR